MNEDRVAPHPLLERYYQSEAQRQSYLASSFDRTARHYDRINTWMSFGSDRWYRRQALLRAGLKPGMRVADIGCGTGLVSQIARQIVGPQGFVVSLDPSPGMLGEAVARGRAVSPLLGKAENLPLKDGTMDFVCMGFALRHVTDLNATFREYLRILRPGGRVLLMEMTPPRRGLFRACLKTHMRYVIPVLAWLTTGSKTAKILYEYCWDTFDLCVPPEQVVANLTTAGLENATRHLSARIFSEYTARRPE